ncbi:MAG: UDP-3-O-[3-hydroxymyristoyl] N-acetylglucosamine deacetylase [Verrucomicrobia bacterium]|nr:UDP-3-O-[3-hydroxymyristoyl] N-acetylglucosamine deacetylase [Verrucomicrobiota bacterium]
MTSQCELPVAPPLSGVSLKERQRTLHQAVSADGIGLFTGEPVTLRLCPAEAGQGILFKRTDLPHQPLIPARLENIQGTPRCTLIGSGPDKVQTVEHLLAALRAYGIDNLLIEISGSEVPIFDGSSAHFVNMIEEAGVRELDVEREVIKLKTPLYWSQGETHIIALPAEEYRISYTLHYPHEAAIGTQFYSFTLNSEHFKKEIAPCRTFSIYEEIAPMIEKGLVKGGSLENAVIIKEGAVANPEGLRFPDEMVRHKILDVIGDLSLMPPFLAHIIAVRSGHTSNTTFAKALLNHISVSSPSEPAQSRQGRGHLNKNGEFVMGAPASNSSVVLNIKEISKILPHRYPFLLVDKVTYLNLEDNEIIGQKNVTMNEQFFQGHFPDAPIMPGVLILEALAQAGGILVHKKGYNEKIAVLLNINNAKFRKPVVPGDVLMLHAKGLHFSGKGGRIMAKALVGEQLAVEAEIAFAMVDKQQL